MIQPRTQRAPVDASAACHAVNLSIVEAARRIGYHADASLDFLCECGRDGCLAVVCLTVGEFTRRSDVGLVIARHHASERRAPPAETTRYRTG